MEMPEWYESEVKKIAKQERIAEKAAQKKILAKIARIMEENLYSPSEAFVIYNDERCADVDRELFIKYLMELGLSRKDAEETADNYPLPVF